MIGKKMKVIYIFERRHGYSHDYEQFGMKFFEDKGYEPEVWSVVRWNIGNLEDPLNMDLSGRTRYIDDESQLDDELNRVKSDKCIFIIYAYHGYRHLSYMIRKKIKKAGFEFCNITESPNIDIEKYRKKLTYNIFGILRNEYKKSKYFVKKIIRELKSNQNNTVSEKADIATQWYDLCARIFGPFLCKSMYNFVTVELEYTMFPNQLECLSKRNILVSSWMYDEYLKSIENDSRPRERYVVFVDQFLTGHSDFVKTGIKFPVQNKDLYFKSLNILFSNIEKEYNCPVIIAAHPKAEYIKNEFNNRMIIYNETNDLIKDAELVVVQYSTCFSMIAMYGKAFLNIYAESFFRNVPNLKNTYDLLKNAFECKQLNIEDKEEMDNWKEYVTEYNQCVFDRYKRNYVISDKGIQDKGFWKFVAEKITEL